MSYAVESKKRKFHRVLESISKPLSSENATKQPTSKPAPAAAAARDRIPGDLSIKKVRLSSNDISDFTSVRKSILKTSLPSSRASSTSSSKRPTFVPWDRERFLERLETFRRVDRWTTKPSPINEVQWAKHGWICTDIMRVSCVSGCGGSVVVKVPDEIDELDGYDAEKVQERKQVRTSLHSSCTQSMFTLVANWYIGRHETCGGIRETLEGGARRELPVAQQEL
jgi:C3HC zinc finger-like.